MGKHRTSLDLMKRLVVGALIVYAVIAAIFLVWGTTDAHGPLPMPSPWPSGSVPPAVHDGCGHRCPVSAPVSAPARAPRAVAYVGHWLPSTDTDNGPAITVIAIWVVAIIVIVFCWHYMAYHDDR